MVTLRVLPVYPGATILEMASLLPLSNEPIEMKWGNTKSEIRLLRDYPDRDVTLVVPDLAAMERTAVALGLPIQSVRGEANRAAAEVNSKAGTWREYAARMGPTVSRGMILRATAQYARIGRDVRSVRHVLIESVLNHTAPIDPDVLISLRNAGAKV